MVKPKYDKIIFLNIFFLSLIFFGFQTKPYIFYDEIKHEKTIFFPKYVLGFNRSFIFFMVKSNMKKSFSFIIFFRSTF